MKKIFLMFLVILYGIQQANAHPLDISTNFVSIRQNQANFTTYLHSFEVEYLLSKLGIVPKNIKVYYDNEDKIIKYIKENTNFYNANEKCDIFDVYLPKMEDYEILSRGLEVSYRFNCKNKIESGSIQLSLFTNFPLQANKLTIYDLNNGIENLSPKKYTVLTSKITQTQFDLSKTEEKLKDSDGDGINDQDELIYKTDPYNIDTDGDNFSDYEEVTNSFDPVNKNPSPRQAIRQSLPETIKLQAKSNLEQEKNQKEDKKTQLVGSFYGMDYLEKALKHINDYVKGDKNFFYVFVFVVFLGFVHAFGPGHSKSILISYIIDKNKSFLDSLIFSLIFSITHIVDIIVVFIIAKFILYYYDISSYIVYIQRFSVILLILISLYLVYKSIKNIKNNTFTSCQNSDIKSNIFIGFLSGIAPCTFGWSIFLLLFSLGSFSLIPIFIFALGLGIFICLVLVSIITIIIRKRVFERINLFSKYSPLVSSFMILFVSFYILYFLY